MSNPSRKPSRNSFAGRDDIRRLFGALDVQDVLAILTLAPTVAELEEAQTWLEGLGDVVARRDRPQSAKIAAILDILEEDVEIEEPPFLR
jgi:hypothetical protein